MNDSLIDYSVDYYKEHASEPLLSAYFVKAIYMGDSRKGLEQRRALYREAIDSAYSRSDSTYLVRFYDRLTSLSFGEGCIGKRSQSRRNGKPRQKLDLRRWPIIWRVEL